jgi:hypothetical protein
MKIFLIFLLQEGVQIGEGDIDFDEIIPLFSDYKGTWVPEIWRGHLHGGARVSRGTGAP